MKKRQTPGHVADQMDLFGRGASAEPPAHAAATRQSGKAKHDHPVARSALSSHQHKHASQSSQPAPPTTGALLNVRQAAARLGLSKSTLDKMRCHGTGPKFIKSTARAVRYDPSDLDAWVMQRRRQST